MADNPVLDDEAYAYDSVGNRTSASNATGAISHNLNNELTTYGEMSFDYDDNGNMTRKSVGTAAVNYIYNAANRLIRVEDDLTGLIIAEYGYDPFGRRLWEEVDGVRTYFLYADEGLVAEYDEEGNELRSYGHRPDSTWTTDPLWLKEGGEYYWYQNFVYVVMKHQYAALLFCGVLFLSCSTSFHDSKGDFSIPEEGYVVYEGWGFALQIPDTIDINSRLYTDFMLYEFRHHSAAQEKSILSAYAGNHPNFPETDVKHAQKTSRRINGLKATFFRWKDEPNRFSGEVLISLPPDRYKETGYFTPAYLHFGYDHLEEEDKDIAENIIMSVMSRD